MAKIFYDHLIKTEEITMELDHYELLIEEKNEFITLIDETFHHQTLKFVLDKLPKEHHETFLSKFYEAPHDQGLIKFINEKALIDFEKEIDSFFSKIKKEILLDIKNSKRK
jgi:hypothetical protein